MNFPQLITIARYELIMSWRQRSIPVLTLALIAMPVLFAFFVWNEISADVLLMEQLASLDAEGLEKLARANTASVQFFTWAAIYLIFIIMAPIIMCTIIPKDRQLGVRELLDGLPITPATYLNGKLFGAWSAVFSAIVIAMGIVIVVWRIVLGPLYLPSILSAWLGGGMAILVFNTSLAILLAAGQPNRKRAFAISAIVALVSLVFFATASVKSMISPDDFKWWELFMPARSAIYNYFMFINMASMSDGDFPAHLIDLNRVWQTIGAGILETVLLWLAAHRYVTTR